MDGWNRRMCLCQCDVCSALHRSVTMPQLYLAKSLVRNTMSTDRKIYCWRTVLGAKRVGEMVMARVAVMVMTCALWEVSAWLSFGTDLLSTSTSCSKEGSFNGQADAGKLHAEYNNNKTFGLIRASILASLLGSISVSMSGFT